MTENKVHMALQGHVDPKVLLEARVNKVQLVNQVRLVLKVVVESRVNLVLLVILDQGVIPVYQDHPAPKDPKVLVVLLENQ